MKYFSFFFALLSFSVFGQFQGEVYHELKVKNFFNAQEMYEKTKSDFPLVEQEFIEANLENAFNKTTKSNQIIDQLLAKKHPIPDSIALQLYYLRTDNYIKNFEYAKAADAVDYILKNFKKELKEKEWEDLENSLKIWTALKNEPKQTIKIPSSTREKLIIDKAGLKNLKVYNEKESEDFIFDTGANISVVLESTAKKLNIKIIPAEIDVQTVTGQSIKSDLGICPLLKIGNIEIRNAIFLVFADEAMYFPQIDYKINGILGYPIIEALGEIQLTKDHYFIIPDVETKISEPSNMALDGLIPMISMNGMHFHFDSGATQSMLYHTYWEKFQNEIKGKYPEKEFNLGGAAGSKTFKGYTIPFSTQVLDKIAEFPEMQVLIEKIRDDETSFGNIGQDLIQQFDKMILNFNQMFIKFE
jgi:hypothetical protein